MQAKAPKNRFFSYLFIAIPLWLLVSGAFALTHYFRSKDKQALVENQRMASQVSVESLLDDTKKLTQVIGERNTTRPDQLAAVSSMIRGALGPSNAGYLVGLHNSSTRFPIIHVSAQNALSSKAPVWILTSYDSPRGSVGIEDNATGLASTLGAAQALAAEQAEHPFHFLFLPHVHERESPCSETWNAVTKLIDSRAKPLAVIGVEAMGKGSSLSVTPFTSAPFSAELLQGLGQFRHVESSMNPSSLCRFFTKKNDPFYSVTTHDLPRAPEVNGRKFDADTLAISTGRLIVLIQRLIQSRSSF